MFFFFPPPFRRNNLRSDLVRSAFHLPGKQAKQNHTERMLVRMTFPFVCRSGGNGLDGKAERKGAWQVLCSNGVLLPEKLRWNGKWLLAYLSVTACGLTANLAFRICLRIKEFTDFCDHIKANI